MSIVGVFNQYILMLPNYFTRYSCALILFLEKIERNIYCLFTVVLLSMGTKCLKFVVTIIYNSQ